MIEAKCIICGNVAQHLQDVDEPVASLCMFHLLSIYDCDCDDNMLSSVSASIETYAQSTK